MHEPLSLVLVHGLPLCGKSTLAYALACDLQVGLVSTGFFGRPKYLATRAEFFVSRTRRYETCAKMAEAYVDAGCSVIVEGNFSMRNWRSPIMQLAVSRKCSFVSIYCFCSRKSVIDVRARSRAAARFQMDRESEPKAHIREKAGAEVLLKSELEGVLDPALLEIDSAEWQIRNMSEPSILTRDVVTVLEHWVLLQQRGIR